MKLKSIVLAVVTVGLMVTAQGSALAKEIGMVTISGPGLKTPIEITDLKQTFPFGPDQLDNFTAMLKGPPANLGKDFYTIDRTYIDEKGQMITTDHLRYYPNALDGRGIVQYQSMDGGKSSNEGRWFRTHPEGEAALIKALAEHGVTVGGAEPAAQAAPETPEPGSALPVVMGGALLMALAVGSGLMVARRRAAKARA